MVNLKKLDLDKIPFNQAYNQILNNRFIQVNNYENGILLFGNGYELIEIIGDKDLLELMMNRFNKDTHYDESIVY